MPHTEIEEYGRDITALGVIEASDSKKKDGQMFKGKTGYQCGTGNLSH